MKYSIGEVAKIMDLSVHTLRYYEKEGLLTNIERANNGLRIYSDEDIEKLKAIECLKETGMSIADIREYIVLFDKNSYSYEQRVQLFEKQKEKIEEKLASLNKYLSHVKYKIWYYENIEQLGDETSPNNCENMKELYKKNSR